jgi:phosphoglucomutase
MAISPKIRVEKFRKGINRGAIYTVPSGKRCFLAHTRQAFIFSGEEKTISDAMRKGTACWSLDEETLIQMRAKGVPFVGVLCRESNDIWLTRTEYFFDREKLVFNSRGRAGRRYMPLGQFRHRVGKTRL